MFIIIYNNNNNTSKYLDLYFLISLFGEDSVLKKKQFNSIFNFKNDSIQLTLMEKVNWFSRCDVSKLLKIPWIERVTSITRRGFEQKI